MTEERLAELERAAAGCVGRGHPDWVLGLTAGELAELCAAARYGHESKAEPMAETAAGEPDNTEYVSAVETLRWALSCLDKALDRMPPGNWQWAYVRAADISLRSVLKILAPKAARDINGLS